MRTQALSTLRFVGALALSLLVLPASAAYWNVFNIEGESTQSARIVTYGSLMDMLMDTNRTGDVAPNPSGFGVNIIGSGSDVVRRGGVPLSAPGSLGLVLAGMAMLALRRRGRMGA